jgi:hypothetical protein
LRRGFPVATDGSFQFGGQELRDVLEAHHVVDHASAVKTGPQLA